jgi:hypothetical protein
MQHGDIFNLFLARRDNYNVTSITRVRGGYDIVMNGEHYRAVVLPTSFSFYERRYHLAKRVPSLVICFEHNTVLPIHTLSLRAGNLAQPYELPTSITDIEHQRASKTGARVLLGMYLSGMRVAQTLISELPTTSKKRYLQKAQALSKRTRGRPVAL